MGEVSRGQAARTSDDAARGSVGRWVLLDERPHGAAPWGAVGRPHSITVW